jgi:hypothetical protein
MKLDHECKMQYLNEAIEIAKAAATTPHSGKGLSEIIQATYDKMIAIAEKD